MAEREANGRWKKGQSANPKGRPKKSREERYLHIALSTCTFKDWRAIIDKAIEQAKGGDKEARRFLAEYLMGKPAQTVDLTSGGRPLGIKAYAVVSPDDWPGDDDE